MRYSSPKKLQEFINESRDSLADILIFKDAGIDQMIWVRDVIGFLFRLHEGCYVHSTHKSKSVLLPVYTYTLKDHKVHIRGNFYDWCVAIDKPFMDKLPSWMKDSMAKGYYEGMDTTGCETFCVGTRERMFTILWWLENEVFDTK